MLRQKTYLNDTRGNIAMMFAFVIMVIFMGVGIVYDSFGQTRQFQKSQHLADMAALAAASSGEQDLAELQQIAEDSIASNAGYPNDYTVVVTITPENAIQVQVEKVYEMQFMGSFGYGDDSITVMAEAPPKGQNKLNLTMVLDVTGSMAGAKLTALQTASYELLDSLEADENAPTGNLKISVVPFARYVKIPMTNLLKPWLEVEPTNLHTWQDDENDCGDNDDDGEEDDPDCVPSYVERSATIAWSGCMGSRHAPWNTRDYYVTGQKLQGFAGGGSCHSELLPLTDDMTAVRSRIDTLTAKDDTFIPAGLMWGWRTLTPTVPFDEANTADQNERKRAMLLMTDGQNTRSFGGTNDTFKGVFHWEKDQAAADTMTAEICAKIKETGIVIYTVAFEVTDAATTNMLQNCATDSNKFFDAGNAMALEEAFGTIGHDLADVRLSR